MLRKNTAGQYLYFAMVKASDGSALTGATVTAYRHIDGAAQAACTGTVSEEANGAYKIALSQADTNGNDIGYLFVASTAIPVAITVTTTAGDPTDSVRFGLTALPNAAAAASGGLLISGSNSGTTTLGALTVTGAFLVSGGATYANASGTGFTCSSSGGNGHGLAATGNGSGEGISATGGTTGHGIAGIGGATSGSGISGVATAAGDGMTLNGAGTGDGLHAEALTTGKGIHAIGGATSGSGIKAISQGGNSPGVELYGQGSGDGLFSIGGTDGDGAHLSGGGTSGDGLRLEVTSGVAFRTASMTVTGTLTVGTNAVPWNSSWGSSVATAVLTTQMTESYNVDGAAPTLAQAAFVIMQRLLDFSISSTTGTVKKIDGTTTAYTFTLNSATAPTSIARAT